MNPEEERTNLIVMIYYANHKVLYFQINHSKLFLTSIGLAFIWPAKKLNKEPLTSNIEPVASILENADNLFDNGHYEECYNVLSNYPVRYK